MHGVSMADRITVWWVGVRPRLPRRIKSAGLRSTGVWNHSVVSTRVRNDRRDGPGHDG
jgi:hypothetical protein